MNPTAAQSALDSLKRALSGLSKPAGSIVLPELGGIVLHLKTWRIVDQVQARQVSAGEGGAEKTAELLRLCICDADGQPLPSDGDWATQFPVPLANRVIEACLAANGLGGGDDAKKATPSPSAKNSAS
ncbi:hypothetical protein [Gemmata sp.]|uniref:hypothetical protein n=1 Tax=Gemmata sp. TaxID=1914242 RepID=UPI003F7140B9